MIGSLDKGKWGDVALDMTTFHPRYLISVPASPFFDWVPELEIGLALGSTLVQQFAELVLRYFIWGEFWGA